MALAALSISTPAHAIDGSVGVNLYGASKHFLTEKQKRLKINEYNPGFGLRFTFGGQRSSQIFIEGGSFEDSFDAQARYLSVGFQLRLIDQLRAGFNVGMYSSASTNDGKTFFAPVPMVSYSLWRVTANFVYLPPYEGHNPFKTLGMYATIRLADFSGKSK